MDHEDEAFYQLMAKLKNRYIASRVTGCQVKQGQSAMPSSTNVDSAVNEVAEMKTTSALEEYIDEQFVFLKNELTEVQAEVQESTKAKFEQ